jgi:hypothetical protein
MPWIAFHVRRIAKSGGTGSSKEMMNIITTPFFLWRRESTPHSVQL